MGALVDKEICSDVSAIVVTYCPDLGGLRQLLSVLLSQVGRVVVVDNQSSGRVGEVVQQTSKAIDLLCNQQNLGIAAAQNQGAVLAMMRSDCRYLLFLDQDSIPASGMVRKLRDALREAEQSAAERGLQRVAAAGPRSIDMRTRQVSWVITDQLGWPVRWLPKLPPEHAGANAPPVEVSFLIASGSLVPRDVLRELKGLRSNYFIDHVDTEWCLRARAAGFRLLVVPQAQLNHRLGDSVKRLWFFGWRQVAAHTPLRDYYMFRNTLQMLRDVAMPTMWRIHFVVRLVKFAAYFLTVGDRRTERFAHMWLGVRHGLAGVSGRLIAGSHTCEPMPITELDPAV